MTKGQLILLLEDEEYEVRPENITSYLSSFGKHEPELVAKYIVKLCIRNGCWHPFRKKDLKVLWYQKEKKPFNFYGLVKPWSDGLSTAMGGGWIIKLDGLYHITTDFIDRLWESTQKYGQEEKV